MTTPDHLIDVLSRRHGILRSLLDAHKERHVLVDYLDDSKSTVYKGVSQLQELGLIEPTPDGLRPTLFGVVALDRYDELVRTADFGGLLAGLPPGAIEPSALIGAEVITPDSTAVDRHLIHLETMLRNADTIRGFSPAIYPDYVSILHHRIVDDGLIAEFVLTEEIVADVRREYPDIASDIISADSAMLYRTEEELPFTLLLVSSGDSMEVSIEFGEEGLATGVITNGTRESLRWAETVYERNKRTAEEVTE